MMQSDVIRKDVCPSRSIPYVRPVSNAAGVRRFEFWYKTRRMKKGIQAPLPDDLEEPWYSPAYFSVLTHTEQRQGKIRAVLECLPFSLARCIQLYKISGNFAKRSPSTRIQFDRAAEMLCMRFGWVDVRQMSPGVADRLTSLIAARDNRCKPQEVRAAINTVLAYAARQGTHPELQAALEGLPFRSRRVLNWNNTDSHRQERHSPTSRPTIAASLPASRTSESKQRHLRSNVTDKAKEFIELVSIAASEGLSSVTIHQVMGAAYRSGMDVPKRQTVRNYLNRGVEMQLIERMGRTTYGAIRGKQLATSREGVRA